MWGKTLTTATTATEELMIYYETIVLPQTLRMKQMEVIFIQNIKLFDYNPVYYRSSN